MWIDENEFCDMCGGKMNTEDCICAEVYADIEAHPVEEVDRPDTGAAYYFAENPG